MPLVPQFWLGYGGTPLSTTTKVVIISVGAGAALFIVFSRLLRRHVPTRPPRRTRRYTGRRARYSMRSPNDIASLAGSKVSARSGSPGSFRGAASDRLSTVSTEPTVEVISSNMSNNVVPVGDPLTAQQLGAMGLESLETVITHWEDALAAHDGPRGRTTMLTTTTEESEFSREIQNLLEMAYALQEQSELLFLDQRSVLFRDEHSIDEADEEIQQPRDESVSEGFKVSQKSIQIIKRKSSDPNFDSSESFASALDQVADLRDFENFVGVNYEDYPLFQAALKYHEENTVQCRTIRTELTNSSTDAEYLAKLHCIRQAFDYLFEDETFSQWVCDTGRQILTDLLCLGDKGTKDFLVGYEDLIHYVQNPANWPSIQAELEARNVKAMTFYDICVDFIILDAFRDLDAPPASVIAVVQNRWLSKGFKEGALHTAVWSVLKAKKRMLKFPHGFMHHFYIISEQISPLMAWGFFGPNDNLREICHYFRDQLLAFLEDIFSFQTSRYTTIEEFAADVKSHMQTRANNISFRFSQ